MTSPVSSTPMAMALRVELKAVRVAAGLSQQQLGALIQRSQRSVSWVEQGRNALDLDELDDWCAACGIGIVQMVERVSARAAKQKRRGLTPSVVKKPAKKSVEKVATRRPSRRS